jgi:FkbM family methyltransferase
VEEEGRLDHDQNLLPNILPHIKKGASVIDVGAFIGDHTVAYARKVGDTGRVYAFEPNPVAFKCLKHNTRLMPNVTVSPDGMSDTTEIVPLSGNNGNMGGSYVGTHMKVADVNLVPLDEEIPWGADFIKIDVEGYELKVLIGAQKIIAQYQPVMVIEINSVALERQDTNREEIFSWLRDAGYNYSVMQKNCTTNSPLYDVLCLPVARSPEVAYPAKRARVQRFVVPPAPPPVMPTGESLLSPEEKMVEYIAWLKEFSEKSTHNRMLVMQRLSYAGLKKKVYKKKHP